MKVTAVLLTVCQTVAPFRYSIRTTLILRSNEIYYNMKVLDNLIIYLTQFEPFKSEFPTESYTSFTKTS